MPLRFHTSNIYTIQNIKLWCKLEDKPFELISEVYNGNSKKLQWQCLRRDCGEIFDLGLNSIISMNCGCQFCSGQKVGILNCLATKNPTLAKEWHPTKNGDLTPYDVTVSSTKSVWWQCSKNHEWEREVSVRNSGNNCPYCSGHKVDLSNCLATLNLELASEWHPTLNGI